MLDFRLLGALEVVDGGGRVLSLGTRKQRALLALLLLHSNEVVSRGFLIDQLWGEQPPPSAEHGLDVYVSQLRSALAVADGGGLLQTSPGGYVLRVEPVQIDLERFGRLLDEGRRALEASLPGEAEEKLQAALGEWRGDALADLALEPFAAVEIGWLGERRLSAVEALIEARLALGRHAEQVAELEALVAEHPLRERLRAQLMLALYRSGRQAEALAVYQEGRRGLVDQLGLEPGRELEELERQILRHDPALDLTLLSPEAVEVAPAAEPGGCPPRLLRVVPSWRPVVAVVIGVGVVIAVAAVAVALLSGDGGGLGRVRASGVAWVSARDGRIVRATVTRTATAPRAVAASGDVVWALDESEGVAIRLDPQTGAPVQSVRVGTDAGGIAVGGGSAWVTATADGAVARINLETNELVQRIPVGNSPTGIAFGSGSVWVAAAGERTVARLDAQSGFVVARVHTGLLGTGVAVGSRSVWVTHASDGSLSQIDPDTNALVRTIRVGNGPGALAVAGGAVWVANVLDGTVSRVDTSSGRVTATVTTGEGPSGLVATADGIWVANELGATLVRIDPRRGIVVSTVKLGGEPRGLASASGLLVVPARAVMASHRGGTVRLVSVYDPIDSIDPAASYSEATLEILGLTNDGLVAYRRVGGPGGTELVADLAESVPAPTAGGTTYSFRLRSGIRYSTGQPVRAFDVRASLERMFEVPRRARPDYYAGIVGAAACLRTPARCDLSRGVVIDNAARTVTFHLVRADPEFLYKLALQFAFVLPQGSPARVAARQPLPATGPYLIRSYLPHRSLTLVRNPSFQEWTTARPDGYADRIVFEHPSGPAKSIEAMVKLIERGSYDGDMLLPSHVDELRARYASRVHRIRVGGTNFLYLNPALPPFDRLAVRQALNLAIDRRAALKWPGATPTCQVLPPGFPAYRPYCPYTLHPGARWTAPDVARARRLVTATGTSGMRVTIWTTQGFEPEVAAAERALRHLGYRPTHRIVSFEKLLAGASREQITVMGWLADYPAASNFFASFACRKTILGSCDPSVARRIAQALAAQASNPEATDPQWTALDRRIVDLALSVPLFNPGGYTLTSERVGNYQSHFVYATLLDQLWVR